MAQKQESSKTKIRPLGNRLVVEPEKQEEQTESGIVIPESAKEESPEQGTVLAVGPGRMGDDGNRQKPEVSKGDKVIFKKYAPTEIEVGEEEYFILDEGDVLAILE